MSPFVRDVSQIPLDDGSALRKLWAGMNPPKAENGGGGSGTTSRRHSVSIVQPRRPVVGFNAPGHDAQDESARPSVFHTSSYGGGGGLRLSDDDLADDFGAMSLSKDGPGPSSSSAHPPSQPSSLPIYAPMSRSPLSPDRVSPYQPINLNIPSGTSFTSRQRFGSPSDSGLSAGASPPRTQLEQQLIDAQYRTGSNNGHGSHQQQQQSLTARFIPGKGIFIPSLGNDSSTYTRSTSQSGSGLSSPLSPTTVRPIQPQQGPYYLQQM